MSGGRIAIRGFDYQGIVVLDLLFDHFDRYGPDARVRPEGVDDVDLIWRENGVDRHCYVQIKKPRETKDGLAKGERWRLAEVAKELLPDTLDQLLGNDSRKIWILGDGVQDDVVRLVAAGTSAAEAESELYWSVVHLLSRATVLANIRGACRDTLLRWRFEVPPAGRDDIWNRLVADYTTLLRDAGVELDAILRYQHCVEVVDQNLADVLSRIEIRQAYGSEAEVGQRFRDRLQSEYGLPASVVEDGLFGNLRSFVNDVSANESALIDRTGFEMQLRSAWPQMAAATAPPVASAYAIERPDLRDRLFERGAATFTEVIGISGSGKTTLAAQTAAALADREPDRLLIYVRVRHDAALRDVLSGVAFFMMRRGIPDLFSLAVHSRPADETVIDEIAQLCGQLPRPIQLLLDLAEGSCNAQFGRDLARFARALGLGTCRVAVFGQESSLTTLSPSELAGMGIAMINMRGFTWTEFLRLVERHHASVEKEQLWEIFRRVTVDGPAGFPAQLADSLAKQPSIQAMQQIVSREPEDMVSAAEVSRFTRLPVSCRSAAARIVCLALPFHRWHAEAAFPDENVGAAITALVALGLLRRDAEGLYEMHEIVRAGLESAIAPNVRRSSHNALASFYAEQCDIPAQVYHLTKADRTDEADRLARESFLRGNSWRSLAGYVARRALVSVEEIVEIVARPEPIDDLYLLRNVVLAQPTKGADRLFMRLLIQQIDRYYADPRWAERVLEVILALNPACFTELLALTVTRASSSNTSQKALASLVIASRRQRECVTSDVIAFIRAQPPQVQGQLLPLLLQDGKRDSLTLAFEVYVRAAEEASSRKTTVNIPELVIGSHEDVVEILAALPIRAAAQVMATRSLGFGPVGALLWKVRRPLRHFCTEILKSKSEEVAIRAMAWRVLLFVGAPTLRTLIDPLAPSQIPLEDALLGALFLRDAYDADQLEARLLDSSESASVRITALMAMSLLSADLGLLRARLADLPQDPLASAWDALFLMLFARRPFAAGIPLLRLDLSAQPSQLLPANIAAAWLSESAEAAWPEVTELLLEGVQHTDAAVREASAWGLARRRAANTGAILRARLDVEKEPVVERVLVRAIAASCPASASDLVSKNFSADTILWQCITAGRTRDLSFAPRLIELATDTSICWRTRRAAIWSAGRLPFDSALVTISSAVLAEHPPSVLGQEDYLEIFPALSRVLDAGVAALVPAGESYFVDTVIASLERMKDESQFRDSLPTLAEAAKWLYQSLANVPTSVGIFNVTNTLHLPLLHAATVRSLGLCGRWTEVDAVFRDTHSTWLATKCLMALRSIKGNDSDFPSLLRHSQSLAKTGGAHSILRIVDEFTAPRSPRHVSDRSVVSAPRPLHVSNPVLSYADALRALRGTSGLFDPSRPVALAPLSQEELKLLIASADPANDPPAFTERFTAEMVFTSVGHVVGQRSSTSNGAVSIPERLRPAIAAANRYGLCIPWHSDRLHWRWGDSYAAQFLASLSLQGNASRFYEALEADADVLLPVMSKPDGLAVAAGIIDDRLAQVLRRCLSLGDERFFKCLCILAGTLSQAAALPVLEGLLQRWSSSFGSAMPDLRASEDEMWQGFARLSEHPAFHCIAGWRKSLEDVSATSLEWHRRQLLMRILEADPGSYVTVESRLAQEEDWIHFARSEIDHLDEAAERLFRQTRDSSPDTSPRLST
ncbi:HEAT repeat domain-containing protein [Stenotrophomonas indicatrix]|uniref:HEAT repeat domain-containing protein n=1 Tax=Stenotrophomonas indicatrix TaxID=2045451 RepID=UPI00215B1B9C|nr:HEAT repeat domain-containing protein [Stenotrophomonas indicatrix]MCR8715070.1 HEAT repeat domain-containing protein [Stenotrophomonas indicatrix]